MAAISREKFLTEFANCTQNEGSIDLPQEILDGRANFLFIVDELINHKLTVSELNKSYLFLAGLLLGKYPKIAFTVQENDRIRLPYAALEQLPITKGKLDAQEKLFFAFCAFYSVCIGVFDEKTEQIRRGIDDIKSPSHVLRLLEWEKENHPERFNFLSQATREESQTNFAVSIENPVKAVSIADGYAYLNSLKTVEGNSVRYKRNGSIFGKHGIIDRYTLYFEKDGREDSIKIYINPYAEENSSDAPEGFILNNYHLSAIEEASDDDKSFMDLIYNLIDRLTH